MSLDDFFGICFDKILNDEYFGFNLNVDFIIILVI